MFHCNTQEKATLIVLLDIQSLGPFLKLNISSVFVLKEHLALEKARDTLAYGQQKLSQRYQYLAVDINYARYSHKTLLACTSESYRSKLRLWIEEECDWTHEYWSK